jgi:hypothetical protein
MKQWHDDVDRLLGMAHSTSARSRPRSSRRQREATTSVCSPSVRVHRLMTFGQNSTAGVQERAPGSLWRGHANAAKTSRAATSINTLLRQHRRHQWAPGPKRVSPWLAWAVPPSRTIFARRLGRPCSGRTYRKNTMEHQTRRSSCRCTSPPSRQQVETPL